MALGCQTKTQHSKASTHTQATIDPQRRNHSVCAGFIMHRQNSSQALNGVLIGLLSSFGSIILLAIIFLAVYFLRYTQSGRILLDRIGRPGEYDDEQAFAREEAEALESMDDMARTEYLRAKGMLPSLSPPSPLSLLSRSLSCYPFLKQFANTDCVSYSIHHCQSSRVRSDRYFLIAVPRNPREGSRSMGVRA